LGNSADLHRLIAAAHARRMHVIMDFVANHVSEQNAYFADTVAFNHASPYFNFFNRTATDEAAYYFDWHNLKNLNYDNAEVERLILEAYGIRVLQLDSSMKH
jgi:glycosidase